MKKIIILLAIFLVLLGFVTYVTVVDIDFGSISTLSFFGIAEKQDLLETEELKYESNTKSFESKEAELTNVKNEYTEEKEKYESISDTTLNLVKEATKDVDYSIEYMWIVLGDYAYDNGLTIKIEEVASGSTYEDTTTTSDGEEETMTTTEDITTDSALITSTEKVLKLTVNGRYSDVADFVFEVENDKSLKFKLDNISMKYSSDNAITATFDIYGLTINK